MQIQNLVDPDFTKRHVPDYSLDVDEYANALDNLVIANVDTIPFKSNGEVLLGERVDNPLKGMLWFFGGRMKPGESVTDASVRNIKREVGIDIDGDRLQFTGIYNVMWAPRREPPEENGFQTMHSIMKYECTDTEAAHATPSDGTHNQLRWYSRKELLQMENNGQLHPFLPVVLRDAGLL